MEGSGGYHRGETSVIIERVLTRRIGYEVELLISLKRRQIWARSQRTEA